MVLHGVLVALDGAFGAFNSFFGTRRVNNQHAGCESFSSCAARDEGLVSGLGEDNVIGNEHVVGVELVNVEHVQVYDVADAQCGNVVGALDDDQQIPAVRHSGQSSHCNLGGRLGAGNQFSDDVDTAVACTVRQGAAQCSSLHLLGGALAVVARGGTVDNATAGHVRGADGTLTGTAGTLLCERLAACTGYFGAVLGLVGTLAGSSELSDNNLVQQRHVGLYVEDLCRQVNLYSSHLLMLPSRRCVRIRPGRGRRGRHP